MRWHEIFREDVANTRSPSLAKLGFKQDNPGGEWLLRKQEASFSRKDKCQGAVTAWFTKDLLVSAAWLNAIPGAMGEDRKPGEPKFDRLLALVQEHGFDLSPIHSGLLGINHLGQAYVLEGNTRAAVAEHLGIEMIPFEIKYWNGGELVRSPYDPDTICIMAELNNNRQSGGS